MSDSAAAGGRDWAAIVVCGILALGSVANAWALWSKPPTHQTLPIFTPVSLEMERSMRQDRRQPAGRGGEEALVLAQALLDEPLDPATASALAPRIEAMKATRLRLLDLRNQRHGLNTRLMEVGVAVGTALDAEQWAAVSMRRDALRVDGDSAVFDRLLTKLGGPRGGGVAP